MAEDDEDTDEYAAPEGPPAPAKPQEGEGEGGEQQQTAAQRRRAKKEASSAQQELDEVDALMASLTAKENSSTGAEKIAA